MQAGSARVKHSLKKVVNCERGTVITRSLNGVNPICRHQKDWNMKVSIQLVSACAIFLLMNTNNCNAQPSQQLSVGTEVGQYFPDFRLPSLEDGSLLSLSSFRGKKVLLFQFASW